jgi:hypothetical protein
VQGLIPNFAELLALIVIFGVRAMAIHWHLEMPQWLTRDGMQD